MPSDQTVATLSTRGRPARRADRSPHDRAVLRDLAARWPSWPPARSSRRSASCGTATTRCEPTRPLVFCDPENGWNEIITPADLACAGELARAWEMRLRKEIFWGARDARRPGRRAASSTSPHVFTESDWGLHETKIGGEDGGAYVWDAPVRSYADLARLRFPRRSTVDHAATARLVGAGGGDASATC